MWGYKGTVQVSKGTSHTYTLRLDYSRISILYKKKKNLMNVIYNDIYIYIYIKGYEDFITFFIQKPLDH